MKKLQTLSTNINLVKNIFYKNFSFRMFSESSLLSQLRLNYENNLLEKYNFQNLEINDKNNSIDVFEIKTPFIKENLNNDLIITNVIEEENTKVEMKGRNSRTPHRVSFIFYFFK